MRRIASGLRTSCEMLAASWPSAASFSLCARLEPRAIERLGLAHHLGRGGALAPAQLEQPADQEAEPAERHREVEPHPPGHRPAVELERQAQRARADDVEHRHQQTGGETDPARRDAGERDAAGAVVHRIHLRSKDDSSCRAGARCGRAPQTVRSRIERPGALRPLQRHRCADATFARAGGRSTLARGLIPTPLELDNRKESST